MIKIKKSNTPQVLVNNATNWQQKYLTAVDNGDKFPRDYAHTDIKHALKEECYSKCIYCESKVGHIDYPHVEHIKPKSIFPELVVDWKNLGLACIVCNTNKGTYYSLGTPLINPYEEDPNDFIDSRGAVLSGINARGIKTINQLDLNRTPLLERRGHALKQAAAMIEIAETTQEASVLNLVDSYLSDLTSANNEYSFVIQHALNQYRADG